MVMLKRYRWQSVSGDDRGVVVLFIASAATRRTMHVRATDHSSSIVEEASMTPPSEGSEDDEEPVAKRSRDDGQLCNP